jgi:hypothetical protein
MRIGKAELFRTSTGRAREIWRKEMKNARLITIGLLLVLVILSLGIAQKQGAEKVAGFSFAVYGDSRSMMQLPYKAEEEAQARELMTDMFELMSPEKVAKEIVQKDVKLTYDPTTHELVQMVMPFFPAAKSPI